MLSAIRFRQPLKNGISIMNRFSSAAAEVAEVATEVVEKPVPWDALGRVYATGRRKTSVARVWVKEGSGQFIVNDKPLIEYFQPAQRAQCTEVFFVTKSACYYDVWCTVKGGGITGQAGAVRLGVSRALQKINSELYKKPLRQAGMLTRDSRRVERKKPGQKKARKQYQWVKR